VTARYLVDTSAWRRSGSAADRWLELAEADRLGLCVPVTLEILFTARTRREYEELADELDGFHQFQLSSRAGRLATSIQAGLAERSQHRGPSPVDVLVAAIADVHGTTLLHYDRHFDAIGRVTGQPMEWIARRGSLD
jgi:predicted nucleic acid-binding protein